ncbi:MAG: flavodoxin domain-containing protein [Kiritimatiellae bacterium]|nr:flavodoxin domain-containing protein [Kiritimatiellia bacterium]MDD5521110.1 flavodoxin domain-containing protein [Kiritimatiellia bacterium]
MHTELKKGVYWVGVVDWDLKAFHGHELSTHRGSTYNSYLIIDKKIVLVDTVWGPFQNQLIENIAEIIDPAKIDIVVANHAETDHSGGLPVVMRYCPNATLVVSKRGSESVEGHYHQGWKFQTVKTGDKINIGANDLVFVEAPMLHWPDSMFTYLTGLNILMPNDAFGQHYATAFRFNDQVDENELYEEALKYYVNILTPFSDRVTKKIDEVLSFKLPVDIIAPSHGVIWRKDPLQIVKKYQEWAAQKPEPRVVFLYDTMWNGTRKMAEAIGEGLSEKGVQFRLINVGVSDRNDALVDVFRAQTILVGSPTLNNGPISTLMPVLEDLRGLKFQNKLGAAFGSYGWSGEAVKIIEEHLVNSKIHVIREGIKCKWQPSSKDIEDCKAFGRDIADATLKGS